MLAFCYGTSTARSCDRRRQPRLLNTRRVLVFGTAGRIDELPLTGMTDLQYIADALSSEGNYARGDLREDCRNLRPLLLRDRASGF